MPEISENVHILVKFKVWFSLRDYISLRIK